MPFQHFDELDVPSKEALRRWHKSYIDHDRDVILRFLDLLSENGEEIGEVGRLDHAYENNWDGDRYTITFEPLSPSKIQSLINQFLETPGKRKLHKK
jgi:hypothetical protein